MDKIMSIENITKSFGGIKAVNDVSFFIKKGEIKALIGPNGAGKTTLFNIVTKLYTKDNGKVFFLGKDMDSYKPHELIDIGISRTFQNIQLIDEMSIVENVMIGYHKKMNTNIFDAFLSLTKNRTNENQAYEEAMDVLKFLKIDNIAKKYPNEIPFGYKRLIEIARAFVAKPVMLLLDEPAAGLNESETKRLLKTIFRIWEQGVSILLIEHDMSLVMNCSHSVVVMDEGKKISEGSPSYIQNDEKVIRAYFGK
jgi:branched-chain amino acid transport system ATP-binding protein